MSSESQREREHREILETLEVADQFCTEWELGFLKSTAEWTETRALVGKQPDIQVRLYKQACDLPEGRGKLRKPKPKKKKKSAKKMSPDEAWGRAPTPQEGDEEILF